MKRGEDRLSWPPGYAAWVQRRETEIRRRERRLLFVALLTVVAAIATTGEVVTVTSSGPLHRVAR